MASRKKILERILSGTADANIAFRDLRGILTWLGFEERVRGDHFIFTRDDVAEIIDIQPQGRKAKPYQVKQVRELILRYRLGDNG